MVTSNTFIYVLINYFQLLLFFQICWWDSREGGQPAGMIPMDQCHIDPVYKTIWLKGQGRNRIFHWFYGRNGKYDAIDTYKNLFLKMFLTKQVF